MNRGALDEEDVAALTHFAELRAQQTPGGALERVESPPPPQSGEFSWRRFADDKEALEEWVDSLLRVGGEELERMATEEASRMESSSATAGGEGGDASAAAIAGTAAGGVAAPRRSKGARAARAAQRGSGDGIATAAASTPGVMRPSSTAGDPMGVLRNAADEYVRTREVVDAMSRISGIFGSCFTELCQHCAVYSPKTAALLVRTWSAQTSLVEAASRRLVQQEKRVRLLKRDTMQVVESASAKAEQARFAFDWHAAGLHEVEVELVHKDARLSTVERQNELLMEENARLRSLLAADVFASAADDEGSSGVVGGVGSTAEDSASNTDLYSSPELAMKQLEQQMLRLWQSSQVVSTQLDKRFIAMEAERAEQGKLYGKIRKTLDAVTMQTMGMVVTAIEGDGTTQTQAVQTDFDGTFHASAEGMTATEAAPPVPTTGLREIVPSHIPINLRPLMASYPLSNRINSIELLERLVLEYYSEKIVSDAAHAKAGTPLFSPCEFLYAFLSNRYGLHSLTDPHVVEIAQSVAHHSKNSSRIGLFARFIGIAPGAYDEAPELDRRAMDFLLLVLNNLQRDGVVTLASGLTHAQRNDAGAAPKVEIARSGAIRVVRAFGDDPGLTPLKRAARRRKNSDLPQRSIVALAARVERLATPPSGSARKCLLDDFLNCAVSVWLEDHLRRKRKLQEIFSMYAMRLIAVNGFVLVHHTGEIDEMDLSEFQPIEARAAPTPRGASASSHDDESSADESSASPMSSSQSPRSGFTAVPARPVAITARIGGGRRPKDPSRVGNTDAIVTFVLSRERFHLAMRAVRLGKRDESGVLDESGSDQTSSAELVKQWDAWFDAAVSKITRETLDAHRLKWTHHVDQETARPFMYCQESGELRWELPIDPYVAPEIDYLAFTWLAEEHEFI